MLITKHDELNSIHRTFQGGRGLGPQHAYPEMPGLHSTQKDR